MKLRARRRPQPNEGLVDLPVLFARQGTDCSGGTQFYRCKVNNFAGCCSVDPCSMDDGCPDDNDDDGETTTTSSSTTKTDKSTTTTKDPATHTTVATVTKTNSEGDVETSVVTTQDGAVLPTDLTDSGGSSSDDNDDSSGSGLGGGAIAGIAVGVLALLLILAAFLFWRRRKHKYTPAHAEYPPPMDANDEKFLGALDPASATTASASTTPATIFGKLGVGSRAPTPSTPGRSSVGANGARHSYASSMTSTPPPAPAVSHGGSVEVAQLDSAPVAAQLDSSPAVVAEMDGTGAARPPSELPATPLGTAALKGLGVHHARERSSGGLPPVAENEPDPRATLNPTDGRTYVNSWSSYETPQGPQTPRRPQGSEDA